MVTISNVKVYDLKESIIACRNSMRTKPVWVTLDEYDKSLERAIKLCDHTAKAGEDNFLKGIRVSFDIIYPQYFSMELQRYHFIDIISSASKMHRLKIMGTDPESFNKYVDPRIKDILYEKVRDYNANPSYGALIEMISNCPMGFQLFMRISTNYACLKNIYKQRHNHRLQEDWGAFCDMIRKLPLADKFLTNI